MKAHHPAAGAGLRTLFLGNDPWSVPPMEALAASRHHVVRVFTGVAKPAGRGSKLTPTAVATAARELELPLLEVGTVRSGWALDALQDAEADVLVVVAYGEILTAEVLEVARLGSVNVHFSLLPALRGASPVRHALLLGLSETGVTTMRMDEGLDTGPILLQAREPVRGEDDAGSLGARLAAIGGRLLVDTLDRLATGTLHPRAQDGAGASWAPKLAAQDRVLDWGQDAVALANRIRAFCPQPAATTRFRGEGVKVYRAEVVEGSGEPGAVLAAGAEDLVVAAARGALRLLEVGPAGRRRMTAGEFVRGHRPEAGERLG